MSSLSLNEIHDAVDAKFGDFTIEIPAPTKDDPERTEEIAFRFHLRARKEAREKLAQAYIEMDEARSNPEADQPQLVDVFKEAFKALAVKPQHFLKLEKQLGDDIVLWTYVTNAYAQHYKAQPGEQQPSRES